MKVLGKPVDRVDGDSRSPVKRSTLPITPPPISPTVFP